MIFYTTEEQERLLDLNYNNAVEAKQKEIDELEKRTKEPHKYRAGAYFQQDPRIFYVDSNSKIFILINDKLTECFSKINFENASINNEIVTESELNGRIYKTDKDFDLKVKEFISRHDSYYVRFYIHKMSSQMQYCSGDDSEIPAEIYSEKLGSDNQPEEKIILEDEDKYDLCWL